MKLPTLITLSVLGLVGLGVWAWLVSTGNETVGKLQTDAFQKSLRQLEQHLPAKPPRPPAQAHAAEAAVAEDGPIGPPSIDDLPRLAREFHKSLRAGDDEAREAILETIGQLDRQAVVAALKKEVMNPRIGWRAEAVALATNLDWPEMIEVCIEGMGSSITAVSKPCMRALALAGPSAVPALLTKTDAEGPRHRRVQALKVLGRIADPRALAALAEALQSKDGCVVHAARSALRGYCGQGQPMLLARRGPKGQPEPDDTSAPAEPAPGVAMAVDALLPLLKSDRAEVRVNALSLLGEMNDPRVPAKVIWALHEAPNVDVKRSATRALGRLGDRRAVPYLLRELQSPHQAVRVSAEVALGKLIRPADRQSLRDLAGRDGPARKHAVALLGKLGDAAPDPQVLQALLSEKSSVSDSACSALRKTDLSKSLPALRTATKSPHAHVRKHAARLLRTCGLGDAIPLLIPLLKDENPLVRSEAYDALADSEDPRAFGPMLEYMLAYGALNDRPNYGWKKCPCLKAYARMRPEVFKNLYHNGDARRRSLASRYLAFSGGETWRQTIRKAILEGDDLVTLAAYEAFRGEQTVGLETQLARCMETHGGYRMASFYLNDPVMGAEAVAWAKRHGYEIITVYSPAE